MLAACGGGGSSGAAASPDIAAAALPDCPAYWPGEPYHPLNCEPAPVVESYFNPGDMVVYCATGASDIAVSYVAHDNSLQLRTGGWVDADDVIQDGAPYSCDAERRP
jgi:hypothetical protein